MTGVLRTAFLPRWVALSTVATALAILVCESNGGAQIPAPTQGRILGTACIHSEVITDCNDDYNCSKVNVGNPPNPANCPGIARCALACTAATGTYQDTRNPGNQDLQRQAAKWDCGKQWTAVPNCAFFAGGSRCKCSTSGTASTTNCQWSKWTYSDCGGS